MKCEHCGKEAKDDEIKHIESKDKIKQVCKECATTVMGLA